MEINMGLKKTHVDSAQLNKSVKKINKEKIINKFIEKFPKVKLETIIKINKHCDEIILDLNNEKDERMQIEQIEQIEKTNEFVYFLLVNKIYSLSQL
jgi:hypothetical protein